MVGSFVAGRGQLEPAGQHRVDDDAVAIELDQEELAAASDRLHALPDEGLELRRRAPDGERREGRRGPDPTAGERGVEGLGDDRQVWQFGHGRPIVAARRRVLDSPGPERQDS